MYSFFNSTLLTLLLLGSQVSIGGTMGKIELPKPYDGFYFGASFGISDLMLRESTPISDSVLNLSSTGAVGGGLVGYDYTLSNRFKLGLEGFVYGRGLNVSADRKYGHNPSYRAKSRYNAGFRLLPGYEIAKETVGYALIGYSNGHFSISDNGFNGFIDEKFNKSGVQSGLGVKAAISQRFSIRGEVLYTAYSSKTSNGLSSTIPQVAQIYHNRFSTLEGDLTLVYKFI
ncbi:MAG: outer membrane beta-barrel protein [Legionellaceae bacterium]|nr:outer membrane beta-barrel protein [Legionellaceae bacterium]